MTEDRLTRIRSWIAFALAGVYLVAGITGVFVGFDDTSDTVLWVAFLCGGAALIVAGLVAGHGSGWLSSVLLSIGAAAGGLALLWTIVVPIAVAVLIAMSFAIARRTRASPA